jgi:hypothetical protein
VTHREVDFAVSRIDGPGGGLRSYDRNRKADKPKDENKTFHEVFPFQNAG